MIIDKISNASMYYLVNPYFKEAFEFIEKCIIKYPDPGKYEINGKELYAVVTEYEPSENMNPLYEAHREYIDIQVMITGGEEQWYMPVDELEEETEYNAEEDAQLFFASRDGNKFFLEEGMFAVYYPQDGHLTKIKRGNSQLCRRLILKVKMI